MTSREFDPFRRPVALEEHSRRQRFLLDGVERLVRADILGGVVQVPIRFSGELRVEAFGTANNPHIVGSCLRRCCVVGEPSPSSRSTGVGDVGNSVGASVPDHVKKPLVAVGGHDVRIGASQQVRWQAVRGEELRTKFVKRPGRTAAPRAGHSTFGEFIGEFGPRVSCPVRMCRPRVDGPAVVMDPQSVLVTPDPSPSGVLVALGVDRFEKVSQLCFALRRLVELFAWCSPSRQVTEDRFAFVGVLEKRYGVVDGGMVGDGPSEPGLVELQHAAADTDRPVSCQRHTVESGPACDPRRTSQRRFDIRQVLDAVHQAVVGPETGNVGEGTQRVAVRQRVTCPSQRHRDRRQRMIRQIGIAVHVEACHLVGDDSHHPSDAEKRCASPRRHHAVNDGLRLRRAKTDRGTIVGETPRLRLCAKPSADTSNVTGRRHEHESVTQL